MTDTVTAPAAPAAVTAPAPAPAEPTSFMTDLPVDAPVPAPGSPEAIAAAEAAAAAAATGEGEQETKTPEQIAAEEEAAKAAAGAPEKYAEFTAPEGAKLDATVAEQFAEVAKELNLPQDKAQLLIDKIQPVIAKRQAEQLDAMRADWKAQTIADKEFGGVNLEQSSIHAARAMKEFATPEFRSLLNHSGLGDHPELVRFMVKAGKAISEDTVVTSGGAAGMRTAAEVLYPPSSSVKK